MLRWSPLILVVLLASCGGNSNSPSSFKVSGSVTGLSGSGLVLTDGVGDMLAIAGDGPFAFPDVAAGANVAVAVATQPAGEMCAVSGGDAPAIAADLTTVTVTCSAGSFVVHASVTGLLGTGLVLQDNGGDDLAVTDDGTFAFATPVAPGQPYHVTISQQPSNPTEGCMVASGDGTIGASDVTATVTCSTTAFTVGGTVTGLAGTGLVLDNNGKTLAVSADGTFMFSDAQPSGSTYDVTVPTQPSTPTQSCAVTGGTGTVGSGAVTSIAVTCTTSTYLVGGTVVGLIGSGLVLENNAGDDLPISADGAFAFATPMASGGTYAVTVATQPTGPAQACRVVDGTGTVTADVVASVVIDCTSNRCGNDVIEDGEVCDGIDLAGATCGSLGHAPGPLTCAADCKSYDTSACTGGFVPANLAADGSQFTSTVCVNGLAVQTSDPNIGVCTTDDGVWRLTATSDTSTGLYVLTGEAAWAKADGSGSTDSGPAVQDQTPGAAGLNSVTSDLGRRISLSDAGNLFDFLTRDVGAGTALPTTGPYLAPFPTWNSFRSGGTSFSANPPTWRLGPAFSSYAEQVFAMRWSGGGTAPIHYVGGWDAANAQAFVRWGTSISNDCGPPNNPPANNCSTKVLLGAGATGTVTGMETGILNVQSQQAYDLHVMVYGKSNIDGADAALPTDADADGGIFWTPDQGQHYVEDDTGIGADNNDCATSSDGTGFGNDKNLVFTGVADPSTWSKTQTPRTDPGGPGSPYPVSNLSTYASTMYVGLRGGGSLYKTTNGGASWCRANRGLPTNVEVYQLAIDCAAAKINSYCSDPSLLFAATSAGVYKSNDAGMTWTLAGLDGKVVRSLAIQVVHAAGVTPYIIAASDQPGDVWARMIQDAP